MQKITLVLGLFIFVFLSACSSAKIDSVASITPSSTQLEQIVDDYFEAYLKLNPLFATSIGDHRFDDQMSIPISAEHIHAETLLIQDALAKVKALGECKGQLTCEVFTRDLTSELNLIKNDLGFLMPFNQFDSFFSDYAELASGSSYVTFETAQDYRNFISRTDHVPEYIDTMIRNMKIGMKKKITTPRILVDRAAKQLHALMVADYKTSVFYKPLLKLDEKLAKTTSETERNTIRTQYEENIKRKVYPAYKKLEKFIIKEYRPKARKTHGLLALKGGREYYLALAKNHTTTDLTPEEIMTLGLSEVKRIRAQLEEVKTQFKFKGPLRDFFKSIRDDQKLYPFHTAEEVLNAYRAIYSRVMAQVPAHFRLLPKAPFEIREVEKFKAENASEAYQNGSPDGSRPGIFWVPVPHATKYAAKDMESLFLHEAIPGHHFQISIQQELDMPRYRRFNGNNAYVEGWALYTESLGKDLGMYTDPYQWIGRLSGEMHRAIRLVVDTGMHYQGWTREKAIQYSLDNEPGDLAGITSEIERYMAIPGQALSYKLGELKIQELKQKSKAALGAKYNDRDFHDEILKDGALPLSVLEQKVSRFILQKVSSSK